MSGLFSQVRALKPGRSAFDLSYSKLFTCDFGQLIPVMADEVYPGDIFDIGVQMVNRLQPTVAPIMHELNATVHYFFVPTRLLWANWEDFITGGEDGAYNETASPPPRWSPSSTVVGSLWDYFGFPVGVTPTDALPIQFPLNAYNKIWNEYYRDENVMAEVALTQETVLKRSWQKDYFASALPWQQRGTAPALPISGTSSAVWPASKITAGTVGSGYQGFNIGVTDDTFYANNAMGKANAQLFFAQNTVNLGLAATFNVSDLRLAFQIQKWMERNARCGARYTEALKAHFGVSNGDDRMQRAEYIGGVKFPVIVSEVAQTSATVSGGTPQGKLAGKGLTAGAGKAGKYSASEHGWIIGIYSCMPVPMYSQGIDRQFLRRSRYDYYTPEFANLSEQAIERAEVYASATGSENRTVFGYQGRFDELRTKRNMVCGLFRTDFNYWHLGRTFSSAPALNATFLQMDSTTGGSANAFKRIFAAPSEPGIICHMTNVIKAVRPLPIQSEPGLIDHS